MARTKISKIWIAFVFAVFFGITYGQEVREANLSNLVSQIRSYMPGQNSNAFVIPEAQEQSEFGAVIDAILQADYYIADSLASLLGYILYEWHDTAENNHLYYVLMEPGAAQSGGVESGWGTYIFDPAGSEDVIVEVPHPYHDYNTWRVGFALYQRLYAGFFLMAGTHRYANGTDPRPADVAHNAQNMFHTVHQQVSPLADHAMQVHGFSREDYPDVVLSNGSANPSAVLDTLARHISDEGYTVGIYDGINYSAYGATTNTQGQWSRSNGYSFIHMELERFIRDSESEWGNINEAVHRTFNISLEIDQPGNITIPQDVLLYQNYPNPFNPATTVTYRTDNTAPVDIIIYDTAGRKIVQLLSGNQATGMQIMRWDGRDNYNNEVASGVYIYVLQQGNTVVSRKMLLIR